MTFADQVFLVLGRALSSPQLRYLPDASTGHVTSVRPISGAPLSLFEYLTMNPRPEIRGQEALLPYLVAAGFRVTRERSLSIGTTRRIFDFVVRPGGRVDDDTGSEADPFVVVELKHLGAQQTGGFGALLGPVVDKAGKILSTLHSDFYKARPSMPMIQVGLFTAVDSWGTATAPVHWTAVDCPFLRRYVKGKTLAPNYLAQANLTLSTWELNNGYTRPASWPTASHFNIGPKVSYDTPDGTQVSGCVHYFLGMTTKDPAEASVF